MVAVVRALSIRNKQILLMNKNIHSLLLNGRYGSLSVRVRKLSTRTIRRALTQFNVLFIINGSFNIFHVSNFSIS